MSTTPAGAPTLLEATPAAKILMVCMPWASLAQPSLALGLIKAQLGAAGMPADVAYLNLVLADLVGVETYEATKNRNVMASEWVFAGELNHRVAPEDYLEHLRERGADEAQLALWGRLRAVSSSYLDRCMASVDWSHYSVVAFTTSMMQTVASLALAKRIKAAHPQICIVFGGANCEGSMGRTLHANFPWIDVVLRGEADEVVEELFGRVLAGASLAGIPGVCHRESGASIVGPEPQLVTDLTVNPVPDYHDYFTQVRGRSWVDELDFMVMFESSRGCWWGERSHCKFCALNGQGMTYRAKPVAQIVNELEVLLTTYGVDNFGAADNILDRHSVKDLSIALAERLPGIRVFYDIRASVSRAEMRLMKRGGIAELEAGLESLVTPVLQRMAKGTSGIRNIRFLRRCREFGIEPLWNYLYAFPGERLEDYAAIAALTDPWLHHLPAADVAFPLSLQRYSPYHRAPADNGIKLDGALDDYRFIYDLDQATLDELAYYFKFIYDNGYDPSQTGLLVMDVVGRWRQANANGTRLDVALERGRVVVYDNRTGHERRFALDEADGVIYRMCESPRTTKQIAAHLRKVAPRTYLAIRGRIDLALEQLEAAQLLYREGNKVLALGVPRDEAFWIPQPQPAPKLTVLQEAH